MNDLKIAVLGAYGYTGQLVVAEARRRGASVLAIGRDRERLRMLGMDYRVAAADDRDTLISALRGCHVVIHCAGPFTRAGTAAVEAALAVGCHYLDTSGEQAHIATVFDQFGEAARAAGIAIVPAVNDDGLPSDLAAGLLARQLAEVDTLAIALSLGGSGAPPSRGTLRSLLATYETFRSGGVIFEAGCWRADLVPSNLEVVFPDRGATSVVKFALPAVVTVPRHVRARRVEGLAPADLAARFTGVTPELVEKLPLGPTEAQRRASSFTFVIEARGGATTASAVVAGSDLYGSTAVLAVEAARRLVVEPRAAGVLAASQAFVVPTFCAFLGEHGVRIELSGPR